MQPSPQFENVYITPKGNPAPFSYYLPILSFPPSPKQIYFMSLWISLFWRFIYRNHTTCDFYVTSYSVFKVHSHCNMFRYFLNCFWLNNMPLYVYTPFCPTIRQMLDGHLGHFHLLATMNTHVQVSVWTCFHFPWVKTYRENLWVNWQLNVDHSEELPDCFLK